MSLRDYTELKASIKGFLWGREDVVSQIPDFIRLAEAQMFRRLTHRCMEDAAVIQIANGRAVIPCGFDGVKSFHILRDSTRVPLEYVRPDALERDYTLLPGEGCPYRYYTIVGDSFLFAPQNVSQTYTAHLRYRKRPEPLSDGNPSNWILKTYPDVYLYGSLLQSAPWLHEDERIATWSALFASAINDINEDSQRSSYGATVQAQPSGSIV